MTPVIAKLKEEIVELEEAIAKSDNGQISAELGDVLFSAVNVARHIKVDPEIALRSANARFENRFKWIENRLKERNKLIEELQLNELDKLWSQAKNNGL